MVASLDQPIRDIDLDDAVAYVKRQLDAGALTVEHVALLTAYWQDGHDLDVDGKPGPQTRVSLDRELRSLRGGPAKLAKAYPLRCLSDGRRPVITSRFKSRNPSRPRHNGVDLFYDYDAAKDPRVKVGDGGAAGSKGKARWWIPSGTLAVACADGVVVRASWIATGFRVAVEHADGFESIYVHLRDLRVKVGELVKQGDPVGLVGDNPADHDATHLHFEISPAGTYNPLDPEVWLAGATYLPAV